MKILKYCLIIVFSLFLYTCNKETEGLSKVTTPCHVELLGGETVLVEIGTQFVEPGYEAFEGEKDVTSNVVVSGTLDINMPGLYTKRYMIENSDGAVTIAKRLVVVYDPASATGLYKVSKESHRNTNPSSSPEYASEPVLLIYQEKSGAYNISDLFGGYYSIGRGYGPFYETSGSVKINKDGSVSLVASRTTPWGDKFSSVEGTYDAASKTFELAIDWESGYTFYLILICIS